MNSRRGVTLIELMVSVTVLALFMGMMAWFGKGMTDHRISSERRLKRLTDLQRVMFIIENDLMSARRHTLGNVLCNNVVFSWGGSNFRTSSDPGFDLDYPNLTTDSTNRNAWFFPFMPVIPMGIPGLGTGYAVAQVTRLPSERLHGMGSLAVTSSVTGTPFNVRSPDFNSLRDRQGYVLSGFARGDNDGGGTSAIATILLQDINGLEIASVSNPTANWVNLRVAIPAARLNPNTTYNVVLRTTNTGAPTRPLTSFFDDIALSPDTTIADIQFASALSFNPGDPNVNLNHRNDIGMVFYKSDLRTGDLQAMLYVFSDRDFQRFPATQPTLLRFTTPIPFLDPSGNIWPGVTPGRTLPNIDRLLVTWVGDALLGTNRPIQLTVTVRDPTDPSQTLSLARRLFPPTD